MSPSRNRTPLSNVDTAWLHMEDPTNLMMISAVVIFDEPLDFERLRATVHHRLLRFERFRQRVVEPRFLPGKPYWETDPNFDLDVHIHRIALPAPGDKAMLQETISDLISTPLDYSKPLWQLHVIENYGGGCALLARLHHCIGDGVALAHVLLSLTDTEPEAPLSPDEPAQKRDFSETLLPTLFQPAASVLKTARSWTEALLHESIQTLIDPSRGLELAKLGASGATALGKLLLMLPDPKTIFKGDLGVPKRVAWSEPILLGEVKAVGHVTGGTVNDVLLTVVTGALRRYLQHRGEPVKGLNFRAIVPVNLRPRNEVPDMGNRFGLVFLSLPVGISDPLDRLIELKRRMDEIKDSPEAIVAFGILNAIGMAPSEIEDVVVNVFATKGTAVMTNVPGPQQTLYLAGQPIRSIMFWVPQSGRLGLGVSILSYDGEVRLGVATDAGLVPYPDTIIEGFHHEFDALMELVYQAKTASVDSEDLVPATEVAAEEAPAASETGEEERLTDKPDEEPDRCQATTQAGRQCKNRARPGSKFCHVHQQAG